MNRCGCIGVHSAKRIVLTGGPGAGKTAVLELIRRSFCEHVRVLPEAAGIVFGGGFPREQNPICLQSAQRAIFYVQRELETSAGAHNPAVVLCDRGTIDGVAYWPGPAQEFFAWCQTTLEEQLARYDVVIHLRTPQEAQGYNHQNPLRIESASAAGEIDARILQVWASHPRRFVIEAAADFLVKASKAVELLRAEVPECCRHHAVASLGRLKTDD